MLIAFSSLFVLQGCSSDTDHIDDHDHGEVKELELPTLAPDPVDEEVVPEEVENDVATIPAGTTKVLIETELGNMEAVLYDNTPGHRDNFVKLINEGFYDGLLFHRVIE